MSNKDEFRKFLSMGDRTVDNHRKNSSHIWGISNDIRGYDMNQTALFAR